MQSSATRIRDKDGFRVLGFMGFRVLRGRFRGKCATRRCHNKAWHQHAAPSKNISSAGIGTFYCNYLCFGRCLREDVMDLVRCPESER